MRTPRRHVPQPTLRFSPYAWAKLVSLRDKGETEVGGFGITPTDDRLFVEDFVLVTQCCSPVTVRLNDVAVADFFDEQVDAGRQPDQFARIWIHTHPGSSASPSHVDEETFCRVFGPCDWAVMFILAREGEAYARLRFNVGPGGSLVIPVEVDYRRAFTGSKHEAWSAEYCDNVQIEAIQWALDREAFLEDLPQSATDVARELLSAEDWKNVSLECADSTIDDAPLPLQLDSACCPAQENQQ